MKRRQGKNKLVFDKEKGEIVTVPIKGEIAMTEERVKKVCIGIMIGMMLLILVALVTLCSGCAAKATGRVTQSELFAVEATCTTNTTMTAEFYENGKPKMVVIDAKKPDGGLIEVGKKTTEFLILDKVND